MKPAYSSREGRKKVQDILRSSALETISGFVPATLLLVGFSVVLWGEEQCGNGLRKRERHFGL